MQCSAALRTQNENKIKKEPSAAIKHNSCPRATYENFSRRFFLVMRKQWSESLIKPNNTREIKVSDLTAGGGWCGSYVRSRVR